MVHSVEKGQTLLKRLSMHTLSQKYVFISLLPPCLTQSNFLDRKARKPQPPLRALFLGFSVTGHQRNHIKATK